MGRWGSETLHVKPPLLWEREGLGWILAPDGARACPVSRACHPRQGVYAVPRGCSGQGPQSAEGAGKVCSIISGRSQHRQVDHWLRQGLQVWSPGFRGNPAGATCQVRGEQASEQKGHPQLQPKQPLVVYLLVFHKECHLSKGLPSLGDHLPENGANTEESRDKERFLSISAHPRPSHA